MSDYFKNTKLNSADVSKDTILLTEAINRETFVTRDELRAINESIKDGFVMANGIREAILELTNTIAYSTQQIRKEIAPK